jgi:hypothetical protein
MISITDRAKAYLGGLPHDAEESVWVLLVKWYRGEFDNKRSATGNVIWEHFGPCWTVEVGGYAANKVPEELGEPVAPGVYIYLITHGQPSPRGAIDFENGHLFVREHAA